jgi:hypothetical protein
MGLYVNPTNGTKEAWLEQHGRNWYRTGDPVTGQRHAEILSQGLVPLVLVNNGIFNALGVLYSPREAEDFAREDGRPKIFVTVDRAALADPASGVGEDLLRAYRI